jgi:hypothetical protein
VLRMRVVVLSKPYSLIRAEETTHPANVTANGADS